MTLARGTSQDISAQLAETLYWIELRQIMLEELHRRADGGDSKARDLLQFVSCKWQGPVPCRDEVNLHHQLALNLSDIVARALEALAIYGSPERLIREALTYGVVLPPHLLGEEQNS